MRLLAGTDFALRILMYLAARPGALLSTADLAQGLGLSRHHLQKLVQRLAAEGVLETARGGGGGVRLARPPSAIAIGPLLRRLEDGQALVECFAPEACACALVPRCRLKAALAGAERAFYEALAPLTLADCISPASARH